MSFRTFIAKEEETLPGFKASKDQVTLLLGINAAGDLKLKPMLIYHYKNPKALKGLIKEYLPVVWKANKKRKDDNNTKPVLLHQLFITQTWGLCSRE